MALLTPLAVLGGTALLFAWLAPNHYPPWTSFHGEAAAFAALCFFCLSRLASSKPIDLRRGPLVILVFVPLVTSQWWFGQIAYGGDALVSNLYLTGFALAWWLGANSTDAKGCDAMRWFAVLITAGAVLSVFIAILQWVRQEGLIGVFAAERGPDMRVYSNLAQPNHLASLMVMGTVLTAGLYLRGGIKGWHSAVLIGWFSIGLTLAESRSGFLAALVAGTFALLKGREWGRLGSWRVVLAWWGLLLVLALAWQPLNEALYLQGPRSTLVTGDSGRLVMWRQSVAAISESPWIGYGWRQSIVGQKAGAQFVPGWAATDYAHNLVLDLLLWLGLPLGVLVAGFLCWWLLRTALRARGLEQMILFTAVIPLLVHSLFEFPFAYSYFLFPAGWMLGAVSRLQQGATLGTSSPRTGRVAMFVATLVFGVVSAAVALEYFEVEEDYRVMRFELRHIGSTPPNYAAPNLKLLTQMDELLKLGRLTPRTGMPIADIERLRLGSASFGWATLHLKYAVALGLNGQPAQASRELLQIRSVYGDEAYLQARHLFLELLQQHPQLSAVEVP